jgi:hypothetical protein
MHGTIPKKGLSLKTITALVQAAEPGMWTHERGLCLAIAKTGSAFWALRYSTKTGQRRLMTLETYEPIDAAAVGDRNQRTILPQFPSETIHKFRPLTKSD